jgi:hypothetical protein
LIAVVQPRLSSTQKLYVDIAGYRNPSELFDSFRPDIAVLSDDTVHVLELTCCHELNIEKSREYKQSKYQNLTLSKDIKLKLSVDFLEVTSLGFVANNGLLNFCRNLELNNLQTNLSRRLGEASLRCSFYIFCSRHKPWPDALSDPVF